MKILSGKSLAQVDPDQEEEEASAEELAEMDSFLIGACEDVISALASALGGDFAKPFSQFLPLISQYYVSGRWLSQFRIFINHFQGAKRAPADRSSAIGSFGEIITGLKGSITEYTPVSILHFLY